MKKNFRKVPDFITNRINEFENDNLIVATIIRVAKNDFRNDKLQHLNLNIENNEISFIEEFIPSSLNGTFSKRNIDGYKITHYDQEKIRKTYYMGERPKFGDWSKGSFSLYVTRLVYSYDIIPPRELSIITELIEENDDNFTLKVSVDIIINRTNPNFESELFFALNLLQENVFSVNVFPSNADRQDYLRTLTVTWEIFPPGQGRENLERILRGFRHITLEIIEEAAERNGYLESLNPIEMIYGLSGIRKYFGAKFSENLVVFENLGYGNAIYVLFENWEELSQLSRTEIQNRPSDQYIRIRHTGNWNIKLERIISNKR